MLQALGNTEIESHEILDIWRQFVEGAPLPDAILTVVLLNALL